MKDYMTTAEVCDYLDITRMTLHRWWKSGKIEKYKFGGSVRYKSSDIEKMEVKACRED